MISIYSQSASLTIELVSPLETAVELDPRLKAE